MVMCEDGVQQFIQPETESPCVLSRWLLEP
jgi:hypothetical protein